MTVAQRLITVGDLTLMLASFVGSYISGWLAASLFLAGVSLVFWGDSQERRQRQRAQ